MKPPGKCTPSGNSRHAVLRCSFPPAGSSGGSPSHSSPFSERGSEYGCVCNPWSVTVLSHYWHDEGYLSNSRWDKRCQCTRTLNCSTSAFLPLCPCKLLPLFMFLALQDPCYLSISTLFPSWSILYYFSVVGISLASAHE